MMKMPPCYDRMMESGGRLAVMSLAALLLAGCTHGPLGGEKTQRRTVTAEQFVSTAPESAPSSPPESTPASTPGATPAAAPDTADDDAAARSEPTAVAEAADEAAEYPGDEPGAEPAAALPRQATLEADEASDQVIARPQRDAQANARPATGRVTDNAQRRSFVLDGMVGQVNGRAIYASTFFEPIQDQLTALGRTHDAREFRIHAQQLIVGRLRQIVTDALIYGEAERDLNDAERAGLRQMLVQQREQWVREYGQGSVAVAEQRMLARHGMTLEDKLEDFRQEVVVRRYMQKRILPRINVTRHDIQRRYHERADVYNTPATRTVRVMMFARQSGAQQAYEQLNQGSSFADVARRSTNLYKPDEGGLWGPIAADSGFRFEQLNEALNQLDVGEYSVVIPVEERFWIIKVESVAGGETRLLKDVQREIEEELRREQFQRYSEQHRNQLYRTGSYNPLEQMSETLLEIAISRYGGMGNDE